MADVTGLDVQFIWHQLPLVHGRQYEQVFYSKHEIPIEGVQKPSGLIRTL